VLKVDDRFPIEEQAERAVDRRRFLGLAGCAALLAVAGNLAAERGESSPPLEVAPIDATMLTVGEGRAVAAADGREALLVRLSADEVVAFDRRCPHLGCPVLWSPERGRFECPCHHAAFEARSGRVLFGPPRSGLTPAEIKVA